MKVLITVAFIVLFNVAFIRSAAIEQFEDLDLQLGQDEWIPVGYYLTVAEEAEEDAHLRQRREVEASVDVSKQRRQGTNVNAQVGGTVWQSGNGRSKIEANGNYGRQFGGPGGTSRPNYGGNIKFTHKF